MTSEVNICRLALSHLGDEATIESISPPDGTTQADYCATYYPIARGALLEMFPWPFATKRAQLAEVDNPVPDDWQFAYALPSTCLRPLASLSPGTPAKNLGMEPDADTYPYVVETTADGTLVLYTNVETATLRYIDLVTDTTKFSPLFVVCLARLLASYLAGPILKGTTGMNVAQAQLKIFDAELRKAQVTAANTGRRDTAARVPTWIAARGSILSQR